MLEDMVTVYKIENPKKPMTVTAAVRTLFIIGMLEHYGIGQEDAETAAE